MKNSILFFIELIISFLPFVLFVLLNSKANMKKEIRYKQYLMPVFAVVYSIVLLIFLSKISSLLTSLFLKLAGLFERIKLDFIANVIRDIHSSWGIYLSVLLFNTAAMLLFIILKRTLTLSLSGLHVDPNSFIGKVVGIFYDYDEQDERWYIKDHFGQARTFIKTVYFGTAILSGLALFVSFGLCMKHLISAPFYPVFAIIIIGELAFYIGGLEKDEQKADFALQADNSSHIAMYPMLRKPLKALFGDKLSADGTTVNNAGMSGGGVEDILVTLEKEGGHIGKNYAKFIRKKMADGLKPNIDYVRSGYELASSKSLLFNTPFYDKLNPYVFYAMNRALLTGGRVMIVLGRHGTEDDLYNWCENGMREVSNIPSIWKISVLENKKMEDDEIPDIGIVSRSSVHDLDVHKNNLAFLKTVKFVMVVEPSRLVTTAQIGLNLLIKNCGQDRDITFCSIDQNCDGLVDALSHILMTNITEVSATEYPHGASSYMYWTADSDYLQHRILPGVSRFLGFGTELSMVALKNQVKKTVWYGGDTFPVKDARWIAKQYYHDLLSYAQLPTTQETFDNCFQTSFNMCNEKVNDYSYITVEDDRKNLFEIRRNFATIAEQQGFVNVISSEYMLREYMSSNSDIFTADAKAIPYITADYARTRRNVILTLSLLLCVDSIKEDVIKRQLMMLNIDTDNLSRELWKEICVIFCDRDHNETDLKGNTILTVKLTGGKLLSFTKDETLLYKRMYSVESGQFESVYTIENNDFINIILDDLQNASYIAEQDSQDVYIGTELKGHVYQKYLPGQFFTLNGKYYQMVSTTADDRIMVRRASDHITGRLSYRQVRNYTINHLENSESMGALKSINNIDIHYQFADVLVETPGYWKLGAYNDFDSGDLVMLNGVPDRNYHHKQILRFDFSKLGDAFTDSIRMTLTNLLNEVFVTLFADNQPFISAITPGNFDAPLTYNLTLADGIENADKSIFIIEDSQLDIGLLVAVERNVGRIFQIISDYLSWNAEQIEQSRKEEAEPEQVKAPKPFDVYEEPPAKDDEKPKKKGLKGLFGKIGDWFKRLFKRKNKKGKDNSDGEQPEGELTPKQKKKAEKAAKKAEKKAEKEAKKAAKKAKKDKAEQDVEVQDDGQINIFGEDDAEVESQDDAEVESQDDAEAEPQDDAEIESQDDAEVESQDDAEVESQDDAEAEPQDDAEIESQDDVEIESQDDAEQVNESEVSENE